MKRTAFFISDGTGSLTPGSPADVVLVDAPSLDAWLSTWRAEPVRRTVIAGETVWERRDGSGTEG